jgi:hypothetical protein
MPKSIEFLKKELEKNISYADNYIKKCYVDMKFYLKLPNDCTGYKFEDGVVCQNKDYKLDALTNYQHQIGYMECLKNHSKDVLDLLNMTDIQFELHMVEQKKIDEHNRQEMIRVKNFVDGKIKKKK